MSIPADNIVRITPSVLLPGGNPLSLNGVILTESTRVPMRQIQGFPSADAVGTFFGLSSIEKTLADIYFRGFEGASTLPSLLYFMQYNTSAVAAYLRSGSFSGVTLAQLQALSGVLEIPVNGAAVTSANIDLSTATSFSNAAALIQAGLQSAGSEFVGEGTIDDGAGGVGNTLTITVATSGALRVGSVITGASVTPGTTITALGTGTGGVGTYTVSGAAQLVTPAEAITAASAATCAYDAQLARFVISSPTTGADSTITYATGSLSAGLKLTAAAGAQLSPGADAATPATFMPTVTAASLNWATFSTTFEPVLDDKLAFADWVQGTRQRYAYVAWDTDVTILQGDAPNSFARQVDAANMFGVIPFYEPANDNGNGRKAAFVMGFVASIDFLETNGRTTLAFRNQPGLAADILDETEALNLKLNKYNFYGDYATSNDNFVMVRPGSMPGSWSWVDSYVNQIWLNAQLQLAFITTLMRLKSFPYNTEGYNYFREAANGPTQGGLNNGVIRRGITLSALQRAEINSATGVAGAADALQTNGFYMLIQDATPETRQLRGSPPMRYYYTDGGSIQEIDMASIAVL